MNCNSLNEAALAANYVQKTVSLKSSMTYTSGGKSNSFNANLRVKRDSAIWGLFKAKGVPVEGLRVLLTKDSVKVIDRINKVYYTGDYNYVKRKFNVDLTFDMIQNLLVGNYLGINEEKINCDAIPGGYFVSELKKRVFYKGSEKDKLDEKAVGYVILPKTFRLGQLTYIDPVNSQKLDVHFTEFKDAGGQIPSNVNASILAGKDSSEFKVVYKKITYGKDLSMPFRIPENFEHASN